MLERIASGAPLEDLLDCLVRLIEVLTHFDRLLGAADDPLDRLSRRERQVLEKVVAGRTSKQIAAELSISPASVDTYRARLMLKLDIKHLPGLVRFAIRHGIARI